MRAALKGFSRAGSGSCCKLIFKHYLHKSQRADTRWSTVSPKVYFEPTLCWVETIGLIFQAKKNSMECGEEKQGRGSEYFQLARHTNCLRGELLACPVHWHRHSADCSLYIKGRFLKTWKMHVLTALWVRVAELRGRNEANSSSAEEFILIGPRWCDTRCHPPAYHLCQGSHVIIGRGRGSSESRCHAPCLSVPLAVYKELLQKTDRTAGWIQRVSVSTKYSKWWNPTQQLLAGLWYKELSWRTEICFSLQVFSFPEKT